MPPPWPPVSAPPPPVPSPAPGVPREPFGNRLARVANPLRAAFGLLFLAGLLLFVLNFVAIRFDDGWAWDGWMSRGLLTLVLALFGLAAIIAGAVGAKMWTFERWQRRKQRRTGVS